MQRVIIVGDLHGCYEEAHDLLDVIQTTSSDRIVFVGDLVDRGPHPRACVELAMKHESVLGNHEMMQLHRRHADETIRPAHHLATKHALDNAHWDYLESLPTSIELPEHNVAVVHAGVVPRVSISRQKDHFLLHGQSLRPPEHRGRKPNDWRPTGETWWPSKAPPEAKFWAELYDGPETIVYGHTVFEEPLVLPHSYGIDTGCVFGGKLTALVLPEKRLVSVPARQTYFPPREREIMISGIKTFS